LQRSQKILLPAVVRMYLEGPPTRKVRQITEALEKRHPKKVKLPR